MRVGVDTRQRLDPLCLFPYLATAPRAPPPWLKQRPAKIERAFGCLVHLTFLKIWLETPQLLLRVCPHKCFRGL